MQAAQNVQITPIEKKSTKKSIRFFFHLPKFYLIIVLKNEVIDNYKVMILW